MPEISAAADKAHSQAADHLSDQPALHFDGAIDQLKLHQPTPEDGLVLRGFHKFRRLTRRGRGPSVGYQPSVSGDLTLDDLVGAEEPVPTEQSEPVIDKEISPLYAAARALLEPDSIALTAEILSKQISTDPELMAVDAFIAEKEELLTQLKSAEKISDDTQAAQLRSELLARPVPEDIAFETRNRYHRFKNRLEALQKGNQIMEKGDPRLSFLEQADAITYEGGVLQPGQTEVNKNAVIAFLQNQAFIDSERLGIHSGYNALPTVIRVEAQGDDPLMIPLDRIISAVSFDSWAGRGKDGSATNAGTPSIDSVIDYATRETGIPPLWHVNAFVQPNGRVFYVSENAHRTAALKAQGANAAAVAQLDIKLLTENLLEERLIDIL